MQTKTPFSTKLASVLFTALLVISCDAGSFVQPVPDDPSVPSHVRLDSIVGSITEGDTVQLRAELVDTAGEPIPDAVLEWSSSDESILRVQSTGPTEAALEGVGPGIAAISVGYEDMSVTADVEVHRRPVDLVHVAGTGQEADAGVELADSAVVRVVDRRGDPVSGVEIEFAVISGGGAVSPASSLTGEDGHARTAWTLGASDEQVMQAHATEGQPRIQQMKDSVVVFTAAITADAEDPAEVVDLEMSPGSAALEEGETLRFEVSATDADGQEVSDPDISWESSNTDIATVADGLLRARNSGNARVIAFSAHGGSTIADTADITVMESEATVTGVEVRPGTAEIATGASHQFEAIAHMSDGEERFAEVTWLATGGSIDGNGLYTAGDQDGTFQVIASHAEGHADTASVTVAAAPDEPGTLTITPSSGTLEGIGATLQLSAEAQVADGSSIADPDIEWTSLDPDIATVDNMGTLTARGIGTVLITASALCCAPDTGSFIVAAEEPGTVDDLATASVTTSSVTLEWTQVDDGAGEPADYAIRYGSPTLSWGGAYETEVSVEGTEVGAVRNYTFDGLQEGTDYEFQLVSYRGTLNVDADFGGYSNTVATTTGRDAEPQDTIVTSVTVSPTSHTFTRLGQTRQITATGYNGAGEIVSGAEFTYQSDNPSVVSVDDMGRMTANAAGMAAIVVSSVCCDTQATVNGQVDPGGSSAQPFFADDFEGDGTGAPPDGGENGFSWGENRSIQVSDEISHNGTRSLKAYYDPSTWAEQRFSIGRDAYELWIEFYIYHLDGDEGLGAAFDRSTAEPTKMLTTWGVPLSNPSNSLDGYSNAYHTYEYWGHHGEHGAIRMNRTIPGSSSRPGGYHAFPSASDRGTWIRFRTHYRMSSSLGADDGISETWINDTKVESLTGLEFEPKSESYSRYFRHGYLFGYENQDFPAATAIYLDDIKFYDEDPGW